MNSNIGDAMIHPPPDLPRLESYLIERGLALSQVEKALLAARADVQAWLHSPAGALASEHAHPIRPE